MANIASSKKDARTSAVKAVRNRSLKSSVKTKITKVRRAVAEGATETLGEITLTAVAALDRAAAKGVLHRNNAARRKSRLLKLATTAGAVVEGAAEAPKKRAAPKATAAKATPKGKAAAAAKSKPAAKPAAKKAATKKPAKS
jgi:small subunit ribosomal protein S20